MHHRAVGERVNRTGVLEQFTRIRVLLVLLEIGQGERLQSQVLEATTAASLHARSLLQQTAKRRRRQLRPVMQRLRALHWLDDLQLLRQSPSAAGVAAEVAEIAAAAGGHDAVGRATTERQKRRRRVYAVVVVVVAHTRAQARSPRYHFGWRQTSERCFEIRRARCPWHSRLLRTTAQENRKTRVSLLKLLYFF